MRVLLLSGALIGLGIPVFGQYTGPAILARGEAPASMIAPIIRFRPFLDVASVYDTGLADVRLTDKGELATASSFGVRVSAGLSGTHSWKRGTLGMDYRGGYTQYGGNTTTVGYDHMFLLGGNFRLTRHITFNLRQSAGMFTRDFRQSRLSQTVPFDPAESYIPTTDYFDNRTMFLTTQGDLSYQRSTRMSFNVSGGVFVNKHRSSALSGSVGKVARGDMHYRVSKATTLGVVYSYNRYTFSRAEGGTDAHALAASFGLRPTRRFEISGYAGVVRVESKFIQSAVVDPVIAVLLGITRTEQIIHTIGYRPNFAVRVSRTFHNGVVYASAAEAVAPGNGVFLTSYGTTFNVGYSYSGLRQWSIDVRGGTTRSEATGALAGNYNGYTGSAGISRNLGRTVHLTSNFGLRQYDSGDFKNYNRLIYNATFGIAFTPGNIPLRLW